MVRFASIIAILALALGLTSSSYASHKVRFQVRFENITTGEILKSSTGKTAPLAVAPGLWIVATSNAPIFKTGQKDWGQGLETLAEDGNPAPLSEAVRKTKGVINAGVFNTPVGSTMPGPITPGKAFEFSFEAVQGQKLFLAAMWGQSNDLFYGTTELGIDLFDAKDKPIDGDITKYLVLYDAGTEVNEEPGFGPNQGPRQSAPNTGIDENGVVRPVLDGKWIYPTVEETIRVTITPEPSTMGMMK
jgi:hypothetical protein